jgi:GNAT superfamily N-acetyltransferase
MPASSRGEKAGAIVRRATGADLPVIKQMIHEFADYLNAIDEPEALDPALVAQIETLAFGPSPLCTIEIAEVAGAPVGYMIYFIAIDMDGFAPALYIADLFVRAAWRDRGVGRILMERAAAITREHGGTTLFWTVWNKNPKALEFYRHLGAQRWDEEILMRWEIGGED